MAGAALSLQARVAKDSSATKPAIVLSIGTGYHKGLADLGKRFPSFSTLPAGAYYKSGKNLILGFEYNRFLGNNFRLDSLFGGIVGPSGQVIDKNGNPAVIRYYMRGYTFQGYVGKTFKISPRFKHSHVQVNLGAGILQHYIKMRFDKSLLPQLEGDYAAGYDKLTNGFMLTQTVNYQYYNLQSVCFFAGFNLVQSFTQNQRNWDYGVMHRETGKRNDFYLGFSAGFLIPINLRSGSSNEYYD